MELIAFKGSNELYFIDKNELFVTITLKIEYVSPDIDGES